MTPRRESAEIARLRAEVKRLEAALAKSERNRHVAEAASEALGKASALLQVMLESAEPSQTRPDPAQRDPARRDPTDPARSGPTVSEPS